MEWQNIEQAKDEPELETLQYKRFQW